MALLSHRTPDSPEAKVTEGVSIDDYSTHGGRCGLQIEMRSTERGPKTAGFHVPNALTGCSRVRGGVEHDFRLRSTTATFVYMPHSAVVSILRRPYRVPRAACRAGDVSDPPQKKTGGSCSPAQMAFVTCLCPRPPWGLSRPHLSLREGLEKPPFPLALHRVGSVLAVKGSLRRFAPWTAPGRSERRAVHEGKGGVRAVGCEGELAHDKGYYHSLRRSRKGTFRPYQTPEPQPWGAVTRRAVAQRRSRAKRLDLPLGVGYPGVLILVLGWVLLSVRLPVSPRYGVSLLFSVFYL